MLNVRGVRNKQWGLRELATQHSVSVLALTETHATQFPSTTALRGTFVGWRVHAQPAIPGITRGCGGLALLHDPAWTGEQEQTFTRQDV
mgnify:CR=1 FL=1